MISRLAKGIMSWIVLKSLSIQSDKNVNIKYNLKFVRIKFIIKEIN